MTLLYGAITRSHAAGHLIGGHRGIRGRLSGRCRPPDVSLAPTLGLSGQRPDPPVHGLFLRFWLPRCCCSPWRTTSHRDIHGEEYPATILFAAFGMVALAAATNLLILFLGLEAMTFGFLYSGGHGPETRQRPARPASNIC